MSTSILSNKLLIYMKFLFRFSTLTQMLAILYPSFFKTAYKVTWNLAHNFFYFLIFSPLSIFNKPDENGRYWIGMLGSFTWYVWFAGMQNAGQILPLIIWSTSAELVTTWGHACIVRQNTTALFGANYKDKKCSWTNNWAFNYLQDKKNYKRKRWKKKV